MLDHLCRTKGLRSWWLGVSLGVMRTAPKYAAAVSVRNIMEQWLTPADKSDRAATLIRSAKKSVVAGMASAVLTNPWDVMRNEMFARDERLSTCFRRLCSSEGCRWLLRGCEQNLISNAVPIAITVFPTD